MNCKALDEWTIEDQRKLNAWKREAHSRMTNASSGQELFEAVLYNCVTVERTIKYLEIGLDLSQDGMSPNGIEHYESALAIAKGV